MRHLFAADELELEGGGREEGLQGQAARAMAGHRGAALGGLHDLAHCLLQVLLVRDGYQICFPAKSSTHSGCSSCSWPYI